MSTSVLHLEQARVDATPAPAVVLDDDCPTAVIVSGNCAVAATLDDECPVKLSEGSGKHVLQGINI